MKVLITGSSGFIGAAVTRAVVANGDDVRVLVRPTSNLKNLEKLAVETVEGDLQDSSSLQRALTHCQGLYHVAAHYALWDRDPKTFYKVNVEGTKRLLMAAADAGIGRIVYTSTIGAIGLPDGGGLGREEFFPSENQLSGDYKRSKYLAEQEVLGMAQQGLPVVIVNPTAPVGEGDVKPTPTGQIIVEFMRRRMFAYMETGMNLIDVDDVAYGHVQAMKKGRVGERYILGNQNLMLKDICQILGQITGISPPHIRLPLGVVLPMAHLNTWFSNWVTHQPPRIPLEGVRMAKYLMHYDCSKARKELGLPQNPAEKALEKAVKWFRQHGYV